MDVFSFKKVVSLELGCQVVPWFEGRMLCQRGSRIYRVLNSVKQVSAQKRSRIIGELISEGGCIWGDYFITDNSSTDNAMCVNCHKIVLWNMQMSLFNPCVYKLIYPCFTIGGGWYWPLKRCNPVSCANCARPLL